jgi:RND family efflux transporter MFP subunit
MTMHDHAANDTSVTIDPAVVQNMGVRTAPVIRGPLDLTLRAAGELNAPQPGMHEISMRIGGWIEKLHANTPGMHVRKGDVLFDLYSPDLQVAQQELISAAAARRAADAEGDKGAGKDAGDLLASAKRKLQLWGVDDRDIDAIAAAGRASRTVPFRSPADGEVTDETVVEGSAVRAGMNLMRIEDRSRLWLDAQVYQNQAPLVRLGQTMEANVIGIPGRTFAGKIWFIDSHIDRAARTLTVRATIDNADGSLEPGMYANAAIRCRAADEALLVPRAAVIDTGARQLVFVALSGGHFAPRTVRAGREDAQGRVEILAGLAQGETVVTSGEFLMDVESRTREATEKFSGSSIESMHGAAAGGDRDAGGAN